MYPVVEEYSKLISSSTTFTLKGFNHPEAIMTKDKVLPNILEFLKTVSNSIK